MPTIQERVRQWFLSLMEGYEFDRAGAAHLTRCCASCIAGTLLEPAAAKACLYCSFRKEECCSMRIHTDRKQPDGAAIAFVVITLLTVTVFAILLSRLNAFV